MIGHTPEVRGRIAFTALYAALCLIASERTIASGDPSPLFLLAPMIAVVATGQVNGHEAFLRAALSVAIVTLSGLAVNVAHGRGMPDYQSLSTLSTALTGLFALNLMVIVITSFLLRWAWPTSDHWTH